MPPKGKAAAARSKNSKNMTKKTPVSSSTRANLVFPVGRFRTMLRKSRIASRLSSDAGIVAAATCQFIIQELACLATDFTEKRKSHQISPADIQKSLLTDEEFRKLFANVQISGGGQLPHILKELMPKKKAKKGEEEAQE